MVVVVVVVVVAAEVGMVVAAAEEGMAVAEVEMVPGWLLGEVAARVKMRVEVASDYLLVGPHLLVGAGTAVEQWMEAANTKLAANTKVEGMVAPMSKYISQRQRAPPVKHP